VTGALFADLRDHPVGRDLAAAFRALQGAGGLEVRRRVHFDQSAQPPF